MGELGTADPGAMVVTRCRVVALLGWWRWQSLGCQTGAADSNQFEVVVAITAKCPAV